MYIHRETRNNKVNKSAELLEEKDILKIFCLQFKIQKYIFNNLRTFIDTKIIIVKHALKLYR